MLRLLYPKQHLNSIFELDTAELRRLGIKGIIADMDNTLVPWNDRTVYPRLANWLDGLKKEGFRICIVSNNSADRGGQLARDLDIPAFWYAVKPRRRAFRKALIELNLPASAVAVLGDQIFTDVLGGNRMGLYTILVTPISDKEFIWTKLMRQFERLILRHLQRKNLIR
ncbi:MAG: YqeG family HAD IIIA-type phosphatase [Firmicutes bacterium]|nr:YqeG family HAD IIIA-type phosphatase [Bacillota bacterium]